MGNSDEVEGPQDIKYNIGESGSGSTYGARVLKGFEETPGKTAATVSEKMERDAVAEMVLAINILGGEFVRMEQMKMEMEKEIETMRMEMEMKRSEMILESQQRILDGSPKC
ncbi:hypothetical protein F3Y22_tig00116951pilonHSYRG00701 [Hibiscus syriacus]|uniref:Uncharacterized protein n=1 Tax=Hibiscus syriacus TaxID=106335 RepID=A0A6A2XWN7_HIBSY|nr:hypothetical protein F3Y22_tig00116951pilonHSYRG00701 [Hibiscus syriacus]